MSPSRREESEDPWQSVTERHVQSSTYARVVLIN